MDLTKMSDQALETRLSFLEKRMETCDPKSLPTLNHLYQTVLDEQVRRDLGEKK